MAKHFLAFCLFFYCSPLLAQDTVYAVIKDDRFMVVHEVKKEDNLYSIAQQYSVPALVLSQNNDVSFYEKIEPKRKLFVPLGNYNYMKTKPAALASARAVYIRTGPYDTYAKLSRTLELPEISLRNWNNDRDLSQLSGRPLLIGWVSYTAGNEPTSSPPPGVNSAANGGTVLKNIVSKDTLKAVRSDLELIYNYQTSEEQFLDSLSGMIVFFKPQTTVNNKLLYAFSNELGRGRVIKVVNPSNQKFVFAKIIGPLPATKQYINAKIGLDGRARTELETREVKLWCNFFFKY